MYGDTHGSHRQPAHVLIEKDDGRFAADRYRALTRRELDTPGASSGCMPIDTAPLRFAAPRGNTASGFGRQRGRDLLQTVSDQGPCMNQTHAIPRRHFLLLGAGTLGIALGSASLLSACGGDAISVAPVTTPRLASAANFRDTAGPDGTGYATTSGAAMKKGALYRSSALALSAADLATIDTLGITQVRDLRTTAEIHTQPDVPLAGATRQNLNVLGVANLAPPPTSGAAAVAFTRRP
ncbi:tyrosine-protein phosphatase [Burkholderia sp. 22313]|uniref:tyrosine-protein phosphatase n=1 Tax=Burkholderia sp. 22313 TaxID=3453908 RepID=UPI002BFAAF4A|nr:tyrosine-protein phosphatase [Burkholderia sp.]